MTDTANAPVETPDPSAPPFQRPVRAAKPSSRKDRRIAYLEWSVAQKARRIETQTKEHDAEFALLRERLARAEEIALRYRRAFDALSMGRSSAEREARDAIAALAHARFAMDALTDQQMPNKEFTALTAVVVAALRAAYGPTAALQCTLHQMLESLKLASER